MQGIAMTNERAVAIARDSLSLPKLVLFVAMILVAVIGKFWFGETIGLRPQLPNYLTFSLYGVFLIHLVTAQGIGEKSMLVAVGIGLTLSGYLESGIILPSNGDGEPRSLIAILTIIPALAGVIASLVTHAFLTIRRLRTPTETAELMLVPWILVLAAVISPFFLHASASIYPPYDHYLFLFQDGLGIGIEEMVSKLVALGNPISTSLLTLVYFALWLAVVGHYALFPSRSPAMPVLAVVCGIIGYSLFWLYPAVGPDFIVHDRSILTSNIALPVGLPGRNQISEVPRNCMPSLHCAWGFLFIWNPLVCPPMLRWCLRTFAALTVISAIEIGRHWFIDIVVALPLAVAVQSLCDTRFSLHDPRRLVPILGGATLIACWFVALRLEWFVADSPGWFRWATMAATIVVSIYLLRSFSLQHDPIRQPSLAQTQSQAAGPSAAA
jgi:PAP2 superfamily